jgi:hypothetical protein
MKSLLAAIALLAIQLQSARLWAAECDSSGCAGTCTQCGQCAPTRKICRAVCEQEKSPKTVFSCECEDFCIPGKSTFCGYRCTCDKCCGGKCQKVWQPGCAEVRTRLVLKKSTEEEDVIAYRWEIVELCESCACLGRCRPPAELDTVPSDGAGEAAEGLPTAKLTSMIGARERRESSDKPAANPSRITRISASFLRRFK